MFAKFLHRPALAIVLSILVVFMGSLSIKTLPLAQFPDIAPVQVIVKLSFPGASAQVLVKSTITTIEQAINGVQNMRYMFSSSTSSGDAIIQVFFEPGSDPNAGLVLVKTRVDQMLYRLPPLVRLEGVFIQPVQASMLMYVNLYSTDPNATEKFLFNYATVFLLPELKRIHGVGWASILGARQYAMRVWLQPDRMAALGVTASDISSAIRSQNVQAPAGQIGTPPAPQGTELQYSVRLQGQLTQPGQYEDIIVRTLPDGSILRLGDLGHTELGAQTYESFSRLNGKPATTLIIYQLPTANALDTARGVLEEMERLKKDFPPGVDYQATMNSTLFITESLREVLKTLGEAFVLVVLVVFIFLGNFRATLIPTLAVPVSLVGTIAVFLLLGFSINTLTMFGLVLAIGLVVDDAIVVVEAVEHHIEEGLDPRAATEKAMDEVGGAVVAIALVLTSVFVPVAFVGGITGQLYRQFAVTLAASILISAFVALTLTPALTAMLLRPHHSKRRSLLTRGVEQFNRVFGKATDVYVKLTSWGMRAWPGMALAFAGIVGVIFLLVNRLPTGFVPSEDQGYFFLVFNLPEGAALERTNQAMKRAEGMIGGIPGVQSVMTLGGFNFLTGASQSYNGSFVIRLQPWSERTTPETQLTAIVGQSLRRISEIPEAQAIPLVPPPINGLGTSGGFQFEIEDRTGSTVAALTQASDRILQAASKRPELASLYNTFRANVPELRAKLDRDKASTLGVPISSVFESMQTLLGGLQLNNFNQFGRVYRVMLQAEPQYRQHPSDIQNIFVRTSQGQMVPLSTLVTVDPGKGPSIIQRFNLFRSAEISGGAAPGYSSGQALQAVEEISRENLPAGMGFDWAGLAFQEKRASGSLAPIFGLAFVFVFLFLAAQYESWVVPVAVIFGVPLGVIGAYLAVWMRGLVNDIYVQIGVVMMIGLTAKNAILIVEFAKQQREQGRDLRESALEAARLRFRPIIMTSLAFIFGMLPLVIATGAGSGARHSLGTAVFAGMISATVLEIFFVPVFYLLVQGVTERFRKA